jgi:hypothetical protein
VEQPGTEEWESGPEKGRSVLDNSSRGLVVRLRSDQILPKSRMVLFEGKTDGVTLLLVV